MASFALALGMVLAREPLLALFLVALVWIGDGFGQRVLLLCAAICGVVIAPREQPLVQEARFVSGQATVLTVPRITSDGQGALLEIEGLRVTSFLPAAPSLNYGDRLDVAGLLRPLKEGTEAFFKGRGVVGRLDLTTAVRTEQGPTILAVGVVWRDSFRRATAATLSEPSKETSDALCFNVDSTLDGELKEDLRRTGTVHIVSASGLHVGLFAFFLQWLLSKVPIDRKWQLLLLLIVLVLYMGATGMRPPVVRSVAMAGVILTAYLWKREGDLLSALGLAALVQLLWDPWSVGDLGFHLSFAAVLGLGLFVRFDAGSPIWLERVKLRAKQTVHASVVASLATGPIVAWSFGYVSLISPLANLLIAPLVALIVPLSLLGWASSAFPPLSKTLMVPVEISCRLMSWIVHGLAQIPYAAVELPAFSAWWIPVCYLAMIGLWRKRVRPAA